MSDDDDWGVEPDPTTETQPETADPPPSRPRGARNTTPEPPAVDPPKPEQSKPPAADQDDDGSWISQDKDKVEISQPAEKETNERNRGRGRDIHATIKTVSIEDNVSEVINPNATELEISNNEACSWLMEAQQKKEQNEDEPRGGRGNRGNRGNRGDGDNNGFYSQHNGGEGDRNQRYNRGNRNGDNYNQRNEEGFDQRPRRDYNNDREYQGNRGGGHFNRGGFRGGFNRQGEERGNRGGYNREGQDRGNFNRNREEGGGFNRNYNNRDRDFNGNRPRGGDFGDREEHRNHRNNRQDANGAQGPKDQASTNQKLVPVPGGRVWPSCELYIKGKKLSITLRKVQDFSSKLLIVPYRNLKLDFYPGNFVISSTIDYRAKIKSKGAELQKPGNVYFQKAIGLANYKGLAFLRVDDSDGQKLKASLEEGIETLLSIDRINKEEKFDSIVFPVCEQLCEPGIVIRAVANLLEESNSLREVSLSTKDPKCFERCIEDYQKCIMEMIENNQLSFE